ncbi:MAG: transglutaminase domain-containing protein [Bdellovibrionota bacterium]
MKRFAWIVLFCLGAHASESFCPKVLIGSTEPAPGAWSSWEESLRERTAGSADPFLTAGFDLDAVGTVFNQHRERFPILGELEASVQAGMTAEAFIELRDRAVRDLMEKSQNDTDPETLFAAIEVVRLLSLIESQVEFPSPIPEPIHDEKESADEPEPQPEKEEAEKTEEGQKSDQEPPPDPTETPKDASENGSEGEPGTEADTSDTNEDPGAPAPDRYVPDNKELESQPGKSGRVWLKTDAFVPMGLLASVHYDHVGAEHLNPNPVIRPRPARAIGTPEHQLVVYPEARAQFHLSFPYGVEPLPGDYKGFTVREKSPGEFVAIQSEPQEQLSIPLVTVGPLQMDRRNLPGYTRASGIEAGKWPKAVKEFVKQLKRSGATDSLRLGYEVTEFVKRNFRYYSESETVSKELLRETDALLKRLKTAGLPRPVALAHGGIVNCDGASWIAALILRDFFQVPTRIVGGTTANETERVEDRVWTLARTGVPRHMWIEVWSGEHWEPFDPTPPHHPESEGGDGSSEGEKSKEGGAQEEVPKDSETQGDTEAKEKAEAEKTEEGDVVPGPGHDDSPANPTPLRIMDQGFDTPDAKLLTVLAETIETHAIETALRTGKKVEALRTAQQQLALLHPEGAAATAASLARLSQLQGSQRDFPQLAPIHLLGNVRLSLSQGEYRRAYAELRSLLPLLEALGARRDLSIGEKTYLDQLQVILEEFLKMNHADAAHFDLAERVLSRLSGPLTRRWVSETYGEVLKLGSPALHRFVEDLKSGTLASLSLSCGVATKFWPDGGAGNS